MKSALELRVDTNAYPMRRCAGYVAIGETTDVIDLEHLEDIFYAYREFHIGHATHRMLLTGEEVETLAIGEVGLVTWAE